jgi:integrase
MATLSPLPNGGHCLQFFVNRYRRTIYLSKYINKQMANSIKDVVENLLHCQLNMMYPPPRIISWLDAAPIAIKVKLQNAGLIELPQVITVEQMVNDYITAKKPDVSEVTIQSFIGYTMRFLAFFAKDKKHTLAELKGFDSWYRQYFSESRLSPTMRIIELIITGKDKQVAPKTRVDCKMRLYAYHGRGKIASEITMDDIISFKSWLLGIKVHSATVKRMLDFVRNAFNLAIEKKQLTNNPALKVSCSGKSSRADDRLITLDEYQRLLASCPNNQWRVILASARIGGMRCPSEIMQLRWKDVNFEQNLVYIRIPKTERHKGCSERTVPLFADWRRELERLFFDENYQSSDYVITLMRNRKSVQFKPYIEKISQIAGLGIIPRPFDMMRTTRSNEIEREYGADYENAWIGHSNKIRSKYYWLPNTAVFQKAVDAELITSPNQHQKIAAKFDADAPKLS